MSIVVEITVWTTFFWLVTWAGIFGWQPGVKLGTILIFVGLAYLLRRRRVLSLSVLSFCVSVAQGAPALAAPSFLGLVLALRYPPFDIFTAFFRVPITVALVLAACSVIYAQFTEEEDLLLAPLIVIYLIFTASWAIWSRTVSTLSKVFALVIAWSHMAQAASWAMGAPHWFVWLLPMLAYGFVSAVLWYFIHHQYRQNVSFYSLPF